MPIREFLCATPTCPGSREVFERFFHPSEDPVNNGWQPICWECAQPLICCASRFGVVFSGPLTAKYNDPKRAGAHREGHWVWERNGPDGQPLAHPRPRFLSTFDEQRQYCKQEGLVNPKELPPHAQLVTVDDHESGLRRLLDLPLGEKPGQKPGEKEYRPLTVDEIRQAGGAIKQELRSRGLPGQEI